jgi:hypothetical protein
MMQAGDPDPATRQAGLNQAGAQTNLTNASADATRSGAADAVGDSRALRAENDRLRKQVRLYQEQGARGAAASQKESRMTGAEITAGLKSNDPEIRAVAKEEYSRRAHGSQQQQQQQAPSGGGQPAGGKPLDAQTAQKFKDQAGGDLNKARELARQSGYTF